MLKIYPAWIRACRELDSVKGLLSELNDRTLDESVMAVAFCYTSGYSFMYRVCCHLSVDAVITVRHLIGIQEMFIIGHVRMDGFGSGCGYS